MLEGDIIQIKNYDYDKYFSLTALVNQLDHVMKSEKNAKYIQVKNV